MGIIHLPDHHHRLGQRNGSENRKFCLMLRRSWTQKPSNNHNKTLAKQWRTRTSNGAENDHRIGVYALICGDVWQSPGGSLRWNILSKLWSPCPRFRDFWVSPRAALVGERFLLVDRASKTNRFLKCHSNYPIRIHTLSLSTVKKSLVVKLFQFFAKTMLNFKIRD